MPAFVCKLRSSFYASPAEITYATNTGNNKQERFTRKISGNSFERKNYIAKIYRIHVVFN